jgi:N-acylneuraminate cytidylyltransferase
MKHCIAIITARGGSKRIPRKNIKSFLGKPILQYSIDAAKDSGLFDEVMVSTDDDEIASLAIKLGATVPFMRSAGSSNDLATTSEVLIEVLRQYREIGKEFDAGCCIYPTAPFVTADKLKNAYRLLIDKNADSVIPVTRFSFPIWRSFKLEEGRVSYIWPENMMKRSQDLSPAFYDCGQFYFFNTSAFLKTNNLVSENAYALQIPETEVQDIDNEEDWLIAEIKYKALKIRE